MGIRLAIVAPAILIFANIATTSYAEDVMNESKADQQGVRSMSAEEQVNKGRIYQAVIDYVTSTKHWSRNEYSLEYKGLAKDQNIGVVFVKFLADDQKTPHPGGGDSFEVEVNLSTYRIVKEWHFQ